MNNKARNVRKSSIAISAEAQSKTKEYPTPQTATVLRKVVKGVESSENDDAFSVSKDYSRQKKVKSPPQKELSDTNLYLENVGLKDKEHTARFPIPKHNIIVAASESGSNEDQIERISPPWVKSKTPIKYGNQGKSPKEVKGKLFKNK